jgi:N-acetylmuramoyl-L-alanine amidase
MAAWSYPAKPGDSLWVLSERNGTGVKPMKDLVVPAGDFPRVDRAKDQVQQTVTQAAPQVKRSATVATSGRWSRPTSRIPYTAGDVDMLAHLIQAEAGGEPYAGQVAVAAVVINRIQSGKFPTSVYGVVFEQDAFEPVSNGTYWNPPSDTAYKAAYDALNGWDPSGGAVFFFAPAKTSQAFMWGRPQTTWIGDHIFAR